MSEQKKDSISDQNVPSPLIWFQIWHGGKRNFYHSIHTFPVSGV